MYLKEYVEALDKVLNGSNVGFTTVTFTGKTIKFNFQDTDPIFIHVVNNDDVVGLTVIFQALLNGSKISINMLKDPKVDFEYEIK